MADRYEVLFAGSASQLRVRRILGINGVAFQKYLNEHKILTFPENVSPFSLCRKNQIKRTHEKKVL